MKENIRWIFTVVIAAIVIIAFFLWLQRQSSEPYVLSTVENESAGDLYTVELTEELKSLNDEEQSEDKKPVVPMFVKKPTVVFPDGGSVIVEVVSSDAERTQGLSGRDTMSSDYGMLFLFDKPGRHIFWMKDMKFSIDMIWLKNGKIVDMLENAPVPEGDPEVMYLPDFEVDMVLEILAGESAKHGLKRGDILDINLNP